MKTGTLIFLVFVNLFSGVPLVASGGGPQKGAPERPTLNRQLGNAMGKKQDPAKDTIANNNKSPASSLRTNQVETLDRFLSMTDEELVAIEETIRRIREMSVEERQAYREKIRAYQQLPAADKERLQSAWGRLDAKVKGQWRSFMQSLDAEERTSVQIKLQSIPAEERVRWRIETLRQAGFEVEMP